MRLRLIDMLRRRNAEHTYEVAFEEAMRQINREIEEQEHRERVSRAVEDELQAAEIRGYKRGRADGLAARVRLP